jgi:hypothetical protein
MLAQLAAEPPEGVTTRTATVPSLVGTVALISPGLIIEKVDDSFGPKETAFVAPNPLPVIVTVAPPPAETTAGETESTTGSPEWISEATADLAESRVANPTRRH